MPYINSVHQILPNQFSLPIPSEYCLGNNDTLQAKFILTDEGVLVTGPLRHGLLAAWYFQEPLLTKNIREALHTAEKVYKEKIISAGGITKQGAIQWGSTGFGITEPRDDAALTSEIISSLTDSTKQLH